MTRIGDALLRMREGAPADASALELAPGWVRPLDPHASDNLWTFEPPTPPKEDEPTELPAVAALPGPDAAIVEIATTPGSSPRSPLIDASVAERIVSSGLMSSHVVEHYRRLAATLHEAQKERAIKVVMITSAVVGEGKSLTAANLALTLSGSYRRHVLLVDADLRRPGLQRIFEVSCDRGLSDGLRRSDAATFATFQLSDTLTILPAGEPDRDPLAGLTSPRMTQLIAEARHKFDWVIIDTPPVTLMPDAKLLASMTDAVLLVVASGAADFDVVKQAVKTLGRKKTLGVVLNRAEPEPQTDYYQD